ncbi:hypothetical protein [Undibacterium sp. TC9W]|uniref:hypothetical protein n=1 Tax=Undibacterium sp. TC9W TaxID=3413053 RepID=UPI003BEF7153
MIRTLLSPIYLWLRKLFFSIPESEKFVGKISDWLDNKINADALEQEFNQRYAKDSDALTRGDLEQAAEQRYPSARFPWLWRLLSSIPADMQKPVIIDGRLPGGISVYENIAAKYIDKVTVTKAKKYAVISAAFWTSLFFIGIFGVTTLMQMSALQHVPLGSGVQRQNVQNLSAYRRKLRCHVLTASRWRTYGYCACGAGVGKTAAHTSKN